MIVESSVVNDSSSYKQNGLKSLYSFVNLEYIRFRNFPRYSHFLFLNVRIGSINFVPALDPKSKSYIPYISNLINAR